METVAVEDDGAKVSEAVGAIQSGTLQSETTEPELAILSGLLQSETLQSETTEPELAWLSRSM